MLTTATVDSVILGAAAIHADTCSFTLSARSPSKNLWDAIPRDIDTIRRRSYREIDDYCKQLVSDAQQFSQQIRQLMNEHKLVVIEPIKQEVKGQRGRVNGLSLRAAQRFPFAPPELVQKCLTFQMAVHDQVLSANMPNLEQKILGEVMRSVNRYWHENHAKTGIKFGNRAGNRKTEVSYTDKLLFATAATNAIMLENGTGDYGSVVLVSRDLNHVFRMYTSREDLLRPVCRRLKLLYPRNFIFRPAFHSQ